MKQVMWIKICGITNVEDAEMVAQSGATAIGLNFYAPSKRFVSTTVACEIRQLLGDRIELVGVFVNSSAEEVAEIAREIPLDTVQFHGDESTETIVRFHEVAGEVGIIRAFRVPPDGFDAVDEVLGELQQANVPLKAVLLDAYKPGEYGGTGHQIAPELVRHWIDSDTTNRPPVVLAGGLTADNVAAAVTTAKPWGIDTASGVESRQGQKNAEKTATFVRQAKLASASS